MGTAMRIVKVLAVCFLCNLASHPQSAGAMNGSDIGNKETSVIIELTRLEVTGSSLCVTYKIRNGSDRDIWVCSDVGSLPFEVYLTQDKQTLLIRKRLDVPSRVVWNRSPTPGTYIRLSPGDAKPDSLRIDLPVEPHFVYANRGTAVAQSVNRLALEIGYYDGDLPALVRGILQVASKFSPENWSLNPDILSTYFRGLLVRTGLADFDIMNKDPYGEGRVNIAYSYQALTGEKALHIEVNGVAIPYRGDVEKE